MSEGERDNPDKPGVIAHPPLIYAAALAAGLLMILIYAGISSRTNALPPGLLLPIVQHLMRRGVIEREERYLERKFGDEYLQYKARVPRWI